MSNLYTEYLDDLIKKKIFKNFDEWNKDDFHFLLSLLNYQHYTNLALSILVNLKNWMTYSNGKFFYPLEKIQKILDKYYLNHDIFEEIKEQENIKLNIKKKKDNENNYDTDDFINLDLDNGIINFGDFLSIDTFKFLICVIIFFIIFTVISIFSFSRTNNFDSNYIRDTNLYPHLNNFNTKYFENILNDNDISNKNKNLFDNDILKNMFSESNISSGTHLIINILKKLSKFFI